MKMTPRTRYQPTFSPMARLRDQLNDFFGSLSEGGAWETFETWAPAVDLIDEKNQLVVKAELPGMKKEEINITLQNGVLTISGEHKEEKAEEGEAYYKECCYGRFQRSITLPASVNESKVEAVYRDGILMVKMPKSEEAKRKQIPIHTS